MAEFSEERIIASFVRPLQKQVKTQSGGETGAGGAGRKLVPVGVHILKGSVRGRDAGNSALCSDLGSTWFEVQVSGGYR